MWQWIKNVISVDFGFFERHGLILGCNRFVDLWKRSPGNTTPVYSFVWIDKKIHMNTPPKNTRTHRARMKSLWCRMLNISERRRPAWGKHSSRRRHQMAHGGCCIRRRRVAQRSRVHAPGEPPVLVRSSLRATQHSMHTCSVSSYMLNNTLKDLSESCTLLTTVTCTGTIHSSPTW